MFDSALMAAEAESVVLQLRIIGNENNVLEAIDKKLKYKIS